MFRSFSPGSTNDSNNCSLSSSVTSSSSWDISNFKPVTNKTCKLGKSVAWTDKNSKSSSLIAETNSRDWRVLDAICDCNLCQHNLEPVSATALPARTSDQKTHNYKASTPSSIAGLLVTKGVLYTFRLLSHQLSEASMTSGALSLSPSLKHYHL